MLKAAIGRWIANAGRSRSVARVPRATVPRRGAGSIGATLAIGVIGLLAAMGTAGPALAAGAAIRGAGATFPYPVYRRWAADYQRATGVHVDYEAVGSGAGVEQIGRRQVDFGATDAPMPAAERERLGVLQFPVVIGGVVPVVNIAGLRSGQLKLTGQVLGDIYLGKVRKWDDPAIAALNPGLDLPGANITVVHRSDASGTTWLWSEFLSRSNPDWQARIGPAQVLYWPEGVDDEGNDGVASSVQRTRFAIGYVEYAYARQHNLAVVSVRNRDRVFVQPDRAAFEAAALSVDWRSAADLDQTLIDRGGAKSWPIVGASFVLLPTRPADAARTLEVMKFFDWALERGAPAAAALDYVVLPASAVTLIGREWATKVKSPAGAAVWREGGAGR